MVRATTRAIVLSPTGPWTATIT